MEPELRQRKPQKAKFGSVIAIESADTADSNEEESEDNDNEEEEDDEEDGSHLNPILVMVFFIVVELFWFRGGIFIAVPCTILLEGLGSGWMGKFDGMSLGISTARTVIDMILNLLCQIILRTGLLQRITMR
mmetsp:Transcript_49459/g.72548  ORF Transcript_49459/g.72548 Transcript_49459/m.72548 type:complete len:132 (+) Transcript_49459:420-815(+)